MKTFLLSLGLAALALLSACSSTPNERISRNQALFDSYPPEIQQKIRDGKVDVGFSDQMVLLSLGEPARRFSRTTAQGTTEVWVYVKSQPRVSFGVGVGSYGRRSSVGTGIGVSSGGYEPDELLRVEMQHGNVVAIDYVGN